MRISRSPFSGRPPNHGVCCIVLVLGCFVVLSGAAAGPWEEEEKGFMADEGVSVVKEDRKKEDGKLRSEYNNI